MASPTFVSASTSTIQESTATLSVSHTVSAGSNRKLLVLVETEYTDTSLAVTGAQYNGQNLSAIGSVLVGATFSNTVYAFYLDDANFPTPGTYTLFAYLNVVGAGIIHVIELADAAQGSVEASNSGTATTSQTLSTALTTLTDGAMLIGGIVCGDTATYTGTTGQTIGGQVSGGGTGMAGAVGYEVITTAGGTSMG